MKVRDGNFEVSMSRVIHSYSIWVIIRGTRHRNIKCIALVTEIIIVQEQHTAVTMSIVSVSYRKCIGYFF